MRLRLAQASGRAGCAGFSLIEILVAFLIFGMTISGLIYGYVQANRMAEFSSMSLAAQSLAQQGMEQARSASWDSQSYPPTNGPGTGDEIVMFNNAGTATGQDPTSHTNYSQNDTLDVPSSGGQFPVVDYISISNISAFPYPPLRQIRSDAVWTLPLDGRLYTNTAITQRAPDE